MLALYNIKPKVVSTLTLRDVPVSLKLGITSTLWMTLGDDIAVFFCKTLAMLSVSPGHVDI